MDVEREPIETWDGDSPSDIVDQGDDRDGGVEDSPRRSRSDGWQPRSERGGEQPQRGRQRDDAEDESHQNWGDHTDQLDDEDDLDDEGGQDREGQRQQQGGQRQRQAGGRASFQDRLDRLFAGGADVLGGTGFPMGPGPGYSNGQQQQPQQRQRGGEQQQARRSMIADESISYLAEKMGMEAADVRKHLVDPITAHLTSQFDDARKERDEATQEQARAAAWHEANEILTDVSGEADASDLFGSSFRRATAPQKAARHRAIQIAGQFVAQMNAMQTPVSDEDAMAYAIDMLERQMANRRRGGNGRGRPAQRGNGNGNGGGGNSRGDDGRFTSRNDPRAEAVDQVRQQVERRSRQVGNNPNQAGGRGAAERTPLGGNRRAAIQAVEAAKRKHKRR